MWQRLCNEHVFDDSISLHCHTDIIPCFLELSQVEYNVIALRMLSGLLEWTTFFAFSWISTTWMYGLMERAVPLPHIQHNNTLSAWTFIFPVYTRIFYVPHRFFLWTVWFISAMCWTLNSDDISILFEEVGDDPPQLGITYDHDCPAAGCWPVWTSHHAG